MKLTLTEKDIARAIDHSVLLPHLTRQEAAVSIALGKTYSTASVCVRPCDVKLASEILSSTASPSSPSSSSSSSSNTNARTVPVCTVIGFPHGTAHTASKVAESIIAMEDGATEIDMVMNYGRFRGGEEEDYSYVKQDIQKVCEVVHATNKKNIVKVILENAYLTDAQIVKACQLCVEAGADFVKTSTGFAATGSTIPNLQLMHATVAEITQLCPGSVQVKAAGGIRTLDALLQCLAAGATRIGATATVAIIDEFRARTATTGGVLEYHQQDDNDKKSASSSSNGASSSSPLGVSSGSGGGGSSSTNTY